MSKPDCPDGTCRLANNDDAKSDAASDVTGRTGKSGKSSRSGRSDKPDRSGKSDKSGRSDRSDKSAGNAAAANQSDSVYSFKESMMNDGASQSGSIAGSDAAPPPTGKPKKPAKQVKFAATGHLDGENVVMECTPSSCGNPRHVKCTKFE
jgi:hypothetical protein